jgi:hypothetical protein
MQVSTSADVLDSKIIYHVAQFEFLSSIYLAL